MADLIEEIKKHSSRWIKTMGPIYKNFRWQPGYGAFSVSQSVVERTKEYIKNQEAHHSHFSFEAEYVKFIKEYEIEYDEKFLWA